MAIGVVGLGLEPRAWTDSRGNEDNTGAHDGWNPGPDASDDLHPPNPGLGPDGWRHVDARLRDRILQHMLQDRILDAGGIVVLVEEGVVTLSGFVRHASDVRLAELLARTACDEIRPGAEVVNRLRGP
jgi:hypothetical protein